MLRLITSLLTLSIATACGKSEPAPTPTPAPTPAPAPAPTPAPAPELAEHTVRWPLSPTAGEIPRDMRVSVKMPKGWEVDQRQIGRWVSFTTPRGEPHIAVTLKPDKDRTGDKAGAGVTSITRAGDQQWSLLCQIDAAPDAPAGLLTTVREACAAARVEVTEVALPSELVAAETPKLANCPAATTLSYTRLAPATEGEPERFGEVVSARAFWTSGGMVEVVLANYQVASWAYAEKPKLPEQVKLSLDIWPGDGKHVASGTFPFGNGRDEAAYSDPGLTFGAGRTWAVWGDEAKGSPGVEVIARSADRICGRLHFKDAQHELKGEFVSELVVGRSDL